MSPPKRPPVVLLAVAAGIIAIIGFALWRYSRFNDVYAVNGLPVEVDVTLAGSTQRIPPLGRVTFPRVSAGTHVIEAKYGGKELETLLVFVHGGDHDLVYNVGGTAPLIWARIAYSTYGGDQQPQWDAYCGRRYVEFESVDYAFVEAPKSISIKGGGTVYKTQLTVIEGGLTMCQSWAVEKGTPDIWADWQRLEAKIDPKKALYAVDELARQGDFREAQLLLEQALAAEPSFELHRPYQSVLVQSGQREKALQKYRRAVDDPKASDLDLYLAARVMPLTEKAPFVEQALLRFPDSAWLHYQRGWVLDEQGDSNGAIAEFRLAGRAPPKDLEPSLYHAQVIAQVRAKKLDEAWVLGSRLYPDSDNVEAALFHLRLAELTGHSPAGWDSKLKPHQQRWAYAVLGPQFVDPPLAPKERDPESYRKARDLMRYTLQRAPQPPPLKKNAGLIISPEDFAPPRRALQLAAKASDIELRMIPKSIVWLLLTEAWRLGDSAVAARLSKHATGLDTPRMEAAMRLIATGEGADEFQLVHDEEVAVLWLARGRRLAMLGESPKAAYEEARRLDALHTIVWRALQEWPEPKPGATLAWVPVP